MKCFNPITLTDAKRSVPCGRCYACLRNRQREWFIRLTEEMKVAKNAYFITLTYDNEHLPIDEEGNSYVSKTDIQYFRKRLYKNMGSPSDFRYFLAAEYGPTTMRPHYHAILFNVNARDNIDLHKKVYKAWSKQVKVGSTQRNYFCHPRGVTIDEVNSNRIGYVTGYVMDSKKDLQCGRKVFSLKSKGLGKSYLNSKTRVSWHRAKPMENNYYPLPDGKKMALPEYYRNKIYSDEQKENIKQVNASENWRDHIDLTPQGRKDKKEYIKKQDALKKHASRRYEKLRNQRNKL